MGRSVLDYLTLSKQRVRAVSLTRDLSDEELIDDYSLTPNSLNALRQVGEGIASGGSQRAWKIVGPYGSGKSAFGVVLAQLLEGPSRHAKANQKLMSLSREVADLFGQSNRLVLPIMGTRMSFGLALAVAIDHAAQRFPKSKPMASWRKHVNFEAATFKGRPFNAVAGEMAAEFSLALSAGGEFSGAALIIDEVGKFVEYAALYPEHSDLIALQQVAEAACVAGDDKLIVVAMLHQHFASYAAGVGRALNDEWHKVAARFEEIPFDEPLERYAYFARHALGVKSEFASEKAVVAKAKALYAQARIWGLFHASSGADKSFFKKPDALYPLHPLTLSVIATVSKRHGQSERSFHAFLNSNEPRALRDFANRTSVGAWYRLTDLYDFLSEGYGLRFRDLAAERRWTFAQTAISRVSEDTLSTKVLKVVALLELAQLGISVTADVVAYALDESAPGDVTSVLAQLVEDGVLIARRKGTEYGMAISDAVNIEALYEEAALTNENELIIAGVSNVLAHRYIVANRHYAKTGTIRTMGILVGTPDAWPQVPGHKSGEIRPDAWLKLVLVAQGTRTEKSILNRAQSDLDPLSMTASLMVSAEGRAALAEFAIWQTVLREVNSKHLDPWTTRYVEGRLQAAEGAVERLVTSALIPMMPSRPGPCYWHVGEQVIGSEWMNISQLASWLFEKIFPLTPCVINELINKDKPTSAIVLARQRLFDVILGGDPERQICGDAEFPPERLIHATLLRDTGIWREAGGCWSLQRPDPAAAVNISAVWEGISAQLRADRPCTFAAVLEALAAPPFGVRAGPAGIWVALYLLVNRSSCAIFERGTLILELTAEHLHRMYKSQHTFTLRELSQSGGGEKLLNTYRSVLVVIGCSLENEATYLDVARALYRWFVRLPDFTKQTQLISKDAALIRALLNKATDPIELLTETFRRAHADSKSKLGFPDWLVGAFTELGMAQRRLQETIAGELSKGFGIQGPLSRIRKQLQAECSKEASRLADVKLKSFILRCTDLLLTDEKWLDSVGSLIVQRPLDAWVDDSISRFQEGLTELCGHYKRWMQLVMRRGEAPAASDRFLGLTVTSSGGEEVSVFATGDKVSAALAQKLLAVITSDRSDNKDVAIAALVQALLTVQGNRSDHGDTEEIHYGP